MQTKTAFILVICAAPGCSTSSHPTTAADLGTPRSSSELERLLRQPPEVAVTVETVAAADWAVARSGLINLEHPKAKHLEDGPEPIKLFFHAIRHPNRGLFIVDTGVESRVVTNQDASLLGGLLGAAMNVKEMVVHQHTQGWLAQQSEPLAGVLLTHLHLDHVIGMPDVPAGTPIYVGPGETEARALMNVVAKGLIDDALAQQGSLREWQFRPDPDGRFAGVMDVFGDGSLWALHVPGHTPGSTAYLARTAQGPVLLVGDASHTRWGWDHRVEPGTFSQDIPASAESFRRLRELADRHPSLEVRLGHQ